MLNKHSWNSNRNNIAITEMKEIITVVPVPLGIEKIIGYKV
ncbi:hypothetical protein [Anaeromicrobium sediminis]|nr:hypothetical protein [Anaeromicrobium sediminis]